jgi:predicted nucleotidyltransferase
MAETKQEAVDRLCRANRVAAAYLFGSRADDGLRLLAGEAVAAPCSDLDIGVFFQGGVPDVRTFTKLQLDLCDLFEPLTVDLVPLERVDAIFQSRAVTGHRIFAADSTAADLYELYVMNRAADLLPIQRERERELFGSSTT